MSAETARWFHSEKVNLFGEAHRYDLIRCADWWDDFLKGKLDFTRDTCNISFDFVQKFVNEFLPLTSTTEEVAKGYGRRYDWTSLNDAVEEYWARKSRGDGSEVLDATKKVSVEADEKMSQDEVGKVASEIVTI